MLTVSETQLLCESPNLTGRHKVLVSITAHATKTRGTHTHRKRQTHRDRHMTDRQATVEKTDGPTID